MTEIPRNDTPLRKTHPLVGADFPASFYPARDKYPDHPIVPAR